MPTRSSGWSRAPTAGSTAPAAGPRRATKPRPAGSATKFGISAFAASKAQALPMGRALVWIGGIFAALGVLFVAGAGWFYLADRSFAASGLHAPGTVIDMVGSRDSDGDYSYKPVVEFH